MRPSDHEMNRAYELLLDGDVLSQRTELSDMERSRLAEARTFERDFPRLAELIRMFGPQCYNGEDS